MFININLLDDIGIPYVEKAFAGSAYNGEPPLPWKLDKFVDVKESNWDLLFSNAPGYIKDFMAMMRGTESPSSFAAWVAIHTISAVLLKHTWFKFGRDILYPNIYAILVAPPGECKKSYTIGKGTKILRHVANYIENERVRFLKDIRIHEGRVTSEVLHNIMQPVVKNVETQNGLEEISIGGWLTLILPEMTASISRKEYQAGLITKLCQLYDCEERIDDATWSHGHLPIVDSYCTLIGGMTPEQMSTTLPPEALGGGFLSRTMVVAEYKSPYKHYLPTDSFNEPEVMEELSKRLAWVAVSNMDKGYEFSPEAHIWAKRWYDGTFQLNKDEAVGDSKRFIYSRMDVVLYRLALIIRAQRYEVSPYITVEDLKIADLIIQTTLKQSPNLVENALAQGPYQRLLNKITEILDKKTQLEGYIDRKTLLGLLGRYGRSRDIDDILNMLITSEQVHVFLEGVRQDENRRIRTTRYVWVMGGEKG